MIFLLRTKYLFTVPRTTETDIEKRFEFTCNRVGIRTKDAQFVIACRYIVRIIRIARPGNIDIASYTHDFLSVQIDFFELALSQHDVSKI